MSLGRKAAYSGLWRSLASATTQGIFFLVFALLARLLDKSDFGLVAYAAVFSGFFGAFLRLGYGEALVQRDDLQPLHVSSAFWLSATAGLAMAILSAIAAYPIGHVLSKPSLTPIIQALSLSCIFVGIRSIPIGLLTRDLRFGTLVVVELVASVVGGIVGVSMALSGWGVAALIGHRLASEAIAMTMTLVAARFKPELAFSLSHLRHLTGFSSHVFAFNLLSYVHVYIDQFLVGYYLGDTSLGGYSVAKRLVVTLSNVFISTLHAVTFSGFSRLQNDKARAEEAVYKSTGLIVLIAYPVFMGVAAFAPDVIEALFSERWRGEAPIAQAFCFLSLYSASMGTFIGACKGMGRPEYVTWQRSAAILTGVALFLILVPYGLFAVAIAFVAKAYLVHPFQIWLLKRATGISYARFYATLVGPAIVTALAVAVAYAIVNLTASSLSPLLRVAYAGLLITSLEVALVRLLLPSRYRAILAILKPTAAPTT